MPKKTKEILKLLADGLILKFLRSPRGYFKLSAKNPIPWQRFNRGTLLYALESLYRQELVTIVEGLDGITTIAATDAGKRAAEIPDIAAAIPQPQQWDKRWRLILFDVPETKKKFREAFRYHLRRLGFTEFQRSVFLFPYPCAKEVENLAARLNLQEHISMITAESISDEFKFKKHFSLL